MARPLTPEIREEMRRLADAGHTYSAIARQFHTTRNSVCGIVHRVRHGHEYKGRKATMGRQKQPFRVYRDIQSAANPNLPDSSTPKFADHDEHIRLIAKANNGRCFPVLNLRPAYRVAA